MIVQVTVKDSEREVFVNFDNVTYFEEIEKGTTNIYFINGSSITVIDPATVLATLLR